MHLDPVRSKLGSFKKPSAEEIWYRNGNSYYEKMKFKQALAVYNRLQKKKPFFNKVLYRKAITLSKLHREKEAEMTFMLAIEKEPYETGGCVINSYGSPEARRLARARFDQGLRKSPGHTPMWYEKGLAHANQGEYQEAIDSMDKIIAFERLFKDECKPVFTKAWRMKGSCLYLMYKFQGAESCFERFIALEDVTVFFEMAAQFKSNEEFGKALDEVEKILRIDQDNIRALDDKVTYLIKLGRTDEARKYKERYEDLQSSNPGYWYQRGTELSVHGLNEKAIIFLNRAIKLKPNMHDAWYSKACCLASLGRHKQAVRCYGKALKLAGNSFVMWYEKGLSHAALGENAAASKCFDKVLAVQPDHELALKEKARLNGREG